MNQPALPPAYKSLRATIWLGIGMLIGGLAAAAFGAFSESESTVMALYAGGTITGAAAGVWVGYRRELRSRRIHRIATVDSH